jgi:hypothetical protein
MEKMVMAASTPDKPAAKSSLGLRIALRALLLIAILVAGFALYSWLVLSWSYSEGERAGILQKFSRKGWVCKTYEGELAISIVPGVTPTIWYFSVRDEAIARQVESALGKRVVLHYKEHRGVPSECFGETSSFVDSVRLVE